MLEEATSAFDLQHGPLLRGRLLKLSTNKHCLLLTMHHIISDGWSMGVFIDELRILYGALQQGQQNPLPPLSIQYADYAAWQRQWLSGAQLQRQSEFWQSNLANIPTLLELPTDSTRPAEQNFAGAIAEIALDRELVQGINQLCNKHALTHYMVMLASWAVLMSRLSGQTDIVIGSPVANRNRLEIEPLIGFFVNTLALRIQVDGSTNVLDFLNSVKAQVLAAQQHQDLPFDQVVELVRPNRSLAHAPLFQVMLAWQNTPKGTIDFPGLTLETLQLPHVSAQVDLSLTLEASDEGGIHGELEYATELFRADTIERYLGYWRNILSAMVNGNLQTLAAIPLLPPMEKQQLIHDWNKTTTDYPATKSIAQLFEAQTQLAPNAVAVIEGTKHWTYKQLNQQANQLARQLQNAGLCAGQVVAISLDRCFALVVAELAILKCSASYLPLDLSAPEERQLFMLNDSGAVMIISNDGLNVPSAATALRIDINALNDSSLELDNLDCFDNGDSTAYIMYTSGSTGQPKGVKIAHRGISRLVINNGYLPFSADDRVAFAANPAFDASTMEVWGPLLNGGSLVVIDKAAFLQPQQFAQVLLEQQITVLFITSALFNQYAHTIPEALAQVRYLLTGGERGDVSSFAKVLQAGGNNHLIHCYGPTETTTFAITHRVTDIPEGAKSIPLGKPIANTSIYILDSVGQPVPVGVTGEIYIGGAGVALGYLDRPELTAERFLADPYATEPDALMYKTGDLAYWRTDGCIEFVGRNDFQVKIRGFRIELGEIEARLAAHPELHEVLVMAREDQQGEKRLVVYYSGAETVHAEVLRQWLSDSLPDYMIPAAYVKLSALPVNANGKVDRKALAAPDAGAFVKQAYEAPQGNYELQLAEIWAELLKIDRVGRQDNFFTLGGHSLLAVTLIERLRRLGLHTDVRALFMQPTLAGLASQLTSESDTVIVPENAIPMQCSAIVPAMLPLLNLSQAEIDRIVASVPGAAANIQDIYPLAPLQEGILFHNLLQKQGDMYVLSTLLRISDRPLLDRFFGALQLEIDRHDILRTSFAWTGLSEPVQVVWRQAKLSIEQLILEPTNQSAVEQLTARYESDSFRLDLQKAPLMQAVYCYDQAQADWVVLILTHHLAIDHASLEILMQEIHLLLADQAAQLPTPLPFRNYVAQAKFGMPTEQHEQFFHAQLADVTEPTLPFGFSDLLSENMDITHAHATLDSELAKRIRLQAQALSVTPASLFHLAWAIVLGRISGRDDVVFGTVLFGRMQGGDGADQVLGMFINTLPIRLQLSQLTVKDGILDTQRLLAELQRHEHAPLALAQRCSGVSAPTPLFTALLNYRHSPSDEDSQSWPGITALDSEERTNYPFALSVDDLATDFALTAQTPKQIDANRICSYLEVAITQLSEAITNNVDLLIDQIEILPVKERQELVSDWNRTEQDFPEHLGWHQLFEAWVEKTPDALAVQQLDHSLSYSELNAQANQLAHYLRSLGVLPDQRVAIALPRTPLRVIAMLAVLKAGAAYVPLDPAYPDSRLAYMLTDSEPVVLLTTRLLLPRFTELSQAVTILDLSATDKPWLTQATTNPGLELVGVQPRNLAYVIYTSGSTGQPKGVMVEHRGLVNLVTAQQLSFKIQPSSRIVQFASFSFDACIFELSMALCFGASLHLPATDEVLAGDQLCRFIDQQQISHATLPPVVLASVPDAVQLDSLTTLIVAGDAPSSALAQRWSKDRDFYNAYGPTETTVWASVYKCHADEEKAPPIGQPIANSQIYVLDDQLRPSPMGVTGEIYIGGIGIARGYLNKPALTAERFIADPFVNSISNRIYKTGDLGKWLPDGTLAFQGRNDFQVKIRGFRIELGEIEAALQQQPEVIDAVVLAKKDSSGDARLLAYFTTDGEVIPVPISSHTAPSPTGEGWDEGLNKKLIGIGTTHESLRSRLAAQLPDYMVPAFFIKMDSFPLTANGKLDRLALPEPDFLSTTENYIAPRNTLECLIAGIWQKLFKIEQISVQTNFFALGGHSLLAVQLVSALGQINVDISISELFAHASIAELADYYAQQSDVGRNFETIPLRASGTLAPLFLVYEVSGELFYGPVLAQHMDSGFPIFGLSAPAVSETPLLSIYSMAARCVAQIRQVQPIGPYRIAGWSFGGMLAYEIANQLIGANQEVSFLGLLDTPLTTQTKLPELALSDTQFLLQVMASELSSCVTDQQALADLDFPSLVQFCQKQGLVPDQLSINDVQLFINRWRNHLLAYNDYHAQPISIPLTLFSATDNACVDPYLGWQNLLPTNQVRVIPVSGNHQTMMDDPHVVSLAKALSEQLLPDQMKQALPEFSYKPLLTIRTGNNSQPKIFCVPGAGANVTCFNDLADVLDKSQTIVGVQPRGLDGQLIPHTTVTAAATTYVQAIQETYPDEPVHLLGHSFGGWVAFEMAIQLQALGRTVLSVNLIDSRTPNGLSETASEYSNAQVLLRLGEILAQSASSPLHISAEQLVGLSISDQLELLKQQLIATGLLPSRTQTQYLQGVVRTFAANLRTVYKPESMFNGAVNLVLARDPLLVENAWIRKRTNIADGWRYFAPQLTESFSLGNHMTVLSPPYVQSLVTNLFPPTSNTFSLLDVSNFRG
jgi:amino acid adenylation domain-containing protein